MAAKEDVSAACISGAGPTELRGHSEAQMEMLHSFRRLLKAGIEGGHVETGRMSASSPLQVSMRPPSSATLRSPHTLTLVPLPPHGKHFQVSNRYMFNICWAFHKSAGIQQAGWQGKVKYQSFMSGIFVSTLICFYCCNFQL